MKCEYCPKQFNDDITSLAIMSFHQVIHHERDINIKNPNLIYDLDLVLVKTHCRNGHEYIPSNLVKSKIGNRICKTCAINAHRRWNKKHRSVRESGK